MQPADKAKHLLPENGAFFVLSPDSILSGRGALVLEALATNQIRVAGYCWHYFSRSEVAQLYTRNRALKPRRSFDAVVDCLFEEGESLCGILAFAGDGNSVELHDTLRTLKGPSDPSRCAPGQLRRSLGATNKVMNLIHTSDDPIESERERSALLDQVIVKIPSSLSDVVSQIEQRSEGRPITAMEVSCLLERRIAHHTRRSDRHLCDLLDEELSLLAQSLDRITIATRVEEICAMQLECLGTASEFWPLFDETLSVGLQRKTYEAIPDLVRALGGELSDWELLVLQSGGTPL